MADESVEHLRRAHDVDVGMTSPFGQGLTRTGLGSEMNDRARLEVWKQTVPCLMFGNIVLHKFCRCVQGRRARPVG
jgi:hypothetical protein